MTLFSNGSCGRIVRRSSDIEGKRLAVHVGQFLLDAAQLKPHPG